ncbi:hypothetical protein LPJ73_005588 [Coemansia sp. RSA 2703]|nr:hypothetical protein LPJ73_005588 [Coemansia sp. RSA 2703]KAJ2375343.1 hypothetical protein IW150_002601 [Coemansia sp. RSA 2607]
MATVTLKDKVPEDMNSELKQMQKLLDDLVVKTQKAEDDATSADADANGSAKIADALKDMLKAEEAIDSLESKLDTLLGRLDTMIDDKEQQQNQKQHSDDADDINQAK